MRIDGPELPDSAAIAAAERIQNIGRFALSNADPVNRKNMGLLVLLRWIAVAGQIVTVAIAHFGLGIPLPLAAMGVVLLALIALNAGLHAWLQDRREVTGRALLFVLLFDVMALTAQLWLSGGALNPFGSLYLLQVTLGAVLLDAFSTWMIVGLSSASFVALIFSSNPLVLPPDAIGGQFSLRVVGMLACFVLDAVLLVVFVTRISRNLRDRDAGLADLRQRAAEEDHIVRMGLLATGAAHELGTPLASLSVILGDWQHMPAITDDPDLAQELDEMEAAVKRCKAIVTGILLSAGEARGEASEATTLGRFVDAIVQEWRGLHEPGTLSLENRIHDHERTIAFDAIVKQAIFNILDNAFEASPQHVLLVIDQTADLLVFRVIDEGPGFKPDMLPQLGKPYQSTKGRPGSGLGLFLVVSVIRKLGGSVAARNLAQGGAEVTLALPFSALDIALSDHD